MEIQRLGQGMIAGFTLETTQISAAMNYCGRVKAFHYHLHQTDCWMAVKGLLQVALVDFRVKSQTYRATQHALYRPDAPLATADSSGRGARL